MLSSMVSAVKKMIRQRTYGEQSGKTKDESGATVSEEKDNPLE